MMYSVYILTSPSGKKYVGQTNNVHNRFIFYKNLICKYQKKLYNALTKYGWDNFTKEIYCECSSREEALLEEMKLIKKYDCFNNGYNSSIGGEYTKQKYYTEEEKIIGKRFVAREYARKYRLEKKEKHEKYILEYNHREEVIARHKRIYELKKEIIKERRKNRRLSNLEEDRRKERDYYNKNKEKIAKRKREYYHSKKQVNKKDNGKS